MKLTTLIAVAGSVLLTFLASAQTPPPEGPAHENHWDISKIDVSKLPAASDQQGVTFARDIAPILKASCVGCHGANRPRGGLRLDSLESTLKGGRDGKMVIPGDSQKSLLVVAAAKIDPGTAMPPSRRRRAGGPGSEGAPPPSPSQNGESGTNTPPGGMRPRPQTKPMTTEQVSLLRAWVDQGAK